MVKEHWCDDVLEIISRRCDRVVVHQVYVWILVIEHLEVVAYHVLVVVGNLHNANSFREILHQVSENFLKTNQKDDKNRIDEKNASHSQYQLEFPFDLSQQTAK